MTRNEDTRGDEPFPWVGILCACIPISLIILAVTLGALIWSGRLC